MKKIMVLVIAAGLSGCASFNENMVNPQTGQTENCQSFGMGAIGTLAAYGIQSECKEKLAKAGFVPADEVPAPVVSAQVKQGW